MQFTIPQFIDIEDKIIGPVSTKQFIIFIIGTVLLFVFYKLLPFALFIPVAIFILILVGLFGFLRINGQPFNAFLLNFIQTMSHPRLMIWRKDQHPELVRDVAEDVVAEHPTPRKALASASRLSQLSLVVDTGGAYQEEDWDMSESDFLDQTKRGVE